MSSGNMLFGGGLFRGQIPALICLICVFWWNLSTLENPRWQMPRGVKTFGQLLRLDQKWNMFAPFPLTDDGWYIVLGTLSNGRGVDLLRGAVPVISVKPAIISATFNNHRWRKYAMNLRRDEYEDFRKYLAKYLCDVWKERLELRSVDVIFMSETSQPEGGPVTVEKQTLYHQECASCGLQ